MADTGRGVAPEDAVTDPTGFRPMREVAHADLEPGYELEPITKTVTLDKSRIYQGWPAVRNRHTDYDAAQDRLTIPAGQISAHVDVTVHGDDLDEGESEHLFLELTNPDNATAALLLEREVQLVGTAAWKTLPPLTLRYSADGRGTGCPGVPTD